MKKKAIILEDEEIRNAYKKVLEQYGYEVEVFDFPIVLETDDEEFKRTAEIPTADLIISDFDAGKTRDDFGYTAARIVAESVRNGIVPLVVGNSSSKSFNENLEAKIQKFYDPNFVLDAISERKTPDGLRRVLEDKLNLERSEGRMGFAK